MKVSVIIPTYCPGDYIWQCLRSLQQQTMEHGRFEVIIVLNGCNEPYHQTLQEGLSEMADLNVRLFQLDLGGVSHARNFGIDQSCGENICFIDDDDWVTECYLENLNSKITEKVVVASNVKDYDEVAEEMKDGYIARAFQQQKGKGKLPLSCGRSFMSSSCCKMIPRSVIAERRFDSRFRLGEDALFMASVSARVSGVVLSDEEAIYYRRLRGTSASRGGSRWEKIKYAMRLSREYVRLYFGDVQHNNLPFFMSRIVASMMKAFKKTWI